MVVGKPAAAVMTSSPGLQGALAEHGRGQGRERQQIGRGAGVGGHRLLHADALRDQALEFLVEAAGGQPAVERGIDQRHVGLGIEHAAGRRHRRLSGKEGTRRFLIGGEFADLVEDALAQGVALHAAAR
jgi:hypothetical protein